MTTTIDPKQIRLPGDDISISQYNLPPTPEGSHITNHTLRSSLAGTVAQSAIQTPLPRPKLPTITSIVLCRIARLSVRQATVAILSVDGLPLASYTDHDDNTFNGVIRKQDIRATEKDKVVVAESFSVGDVVRAEVISLGDERNYYLSTARNELGVVMAKMDDGGVGMPISWREVAEDGTGRRVGRKVAKPDI